MKPLNYQSATELRESAKNNATLLKKTKINEPYDTSTTHHM